MKKHLVIFLAVICLFYSVSAQQSSKQKIRYYEVWISLIDTETRFKGILYEVGDSSLMISAKVPMQDNKAGSDRLTEFSYSKIDLIKARRLKSPSRGAKIGASAGAGIGLSYGIGLYGEAIMMFGGAPALISMFPPAAIGAGAGALLGSIKDRIPLHSDFENFNLYRSSLQGYSLMQEADPGLIQFKHKGFVGATVGLVIPVSSNSGVGYGGTVMAGYRFTENWGISISQYSSQYARSSYSNDYLQSIAGITAGPIISKPVSSKLRLDLKPGIGFSDASLWLDDIEEKSGAGLGLDFNISLFIDLSKRGGLLAEAGYFSTRVKYNNNDKEALRYIHLNLGYVYKFSSRSL